MVCYAYIKSYAFCVFYFVNRRNTTINCNDYSVTASETGTITASGWGGLNGGIKDIVFKVYDANGNEVCRDEQIMTSKAGFFQKIIAFFKRIFNEACGRILRPEQKN